MSFQDILSNVQNAAGAVNGVISAGESLLNALGLSSESYQDQIRPASFRGIDFVVLAAEGNFGRRNAIHEYPNRDTVWVEDMGRAARRISLIGYLVGDDALAQQEKLISACETEDQGELVHPTLGRLTVSLLTLKVTSRWDSGRVVEIGMNFIESGQRTFPSVNADTGSAVVDAVTNAFGSVAGDYASKIVTAVSKGAAVVQQIASTAARWASVASKVISSAAGVVNAVKNLPGSFGRYHGKSSPYGLSGVLGSITTAAAAASAVSQVLAKAGIAKNAVSSSISSMISAAGSIGSS
jgi:prophage DNA circulation protein